MKKNGTMIAVGVFVALLLVVVLTREDHVSEGVKKLSWTPMDKALITKVELSGPQNAVLTKGADGWRVADPKKPEATFATDESQVNALVDALADFKAADHITSKAERYAELEVDDAKGLKVVASGASGPLATLIVGKSGKSGGFYVKLPTQADVFSSTSALGWTARKDANGFRQRKFISLKADDVTGLSVKQASSELALGLKDGVWAVESPVPAGYRFDPSAAQRMVQQLVFLSAQDFSADPAVQTAEGQAIAKTKDGKSVTVSWGKAEKNLVPVRVEGDPQVYLVPPYAIQQVGKKLDDLRDLSVWAFEQAKVNKLSITTPKVKVVTEKAGGAWKVVEPKKLPDGFDFDSNQVDAVVQQLRLVRAARADGSPEAAKACKAPASATVEVTLEDKSTKALRFGGDLGTNEVCLTGTIDALTYAVAKPERERLEKGVELFKRPPPPPQFNPSSIKGLENLPPEVRAQLMQQLQQKQMMPPAGHP